MILESQKVWHVIPQTSYCHKPHQNLNKRNRPHYYWGRYNATSIFLGNKFDNNL